MTFDNVYEMITPPVVQKKSWFVDYFDGDDKRAWWTFTDISGTGGSSMIDEIDEGFEVTTGASNGNRSSINFNDIRHYDVDNFVLIAVARIIFEDSGRMMVGAADGADLSESGTFSGVGMGFTGASTIAMLIEDGTTETEISTGVTDEPFWFQYMIKTTPTAYRGFMDGILRATGTATLPSGKVQPVFLAMAATNSARPARIRYLEVYNT